MSEDFDQSTLSSRVNLSQGRFRRSLKIPPEELFGYNEEVFHKCAYIKLIFIKHEMDIWKH